MENVLQEYLTRGLITSLTVEGSIVSLSVKGSWTEEKNLAGIGSWIIWENSNCIMNDLGEEEEEKTLLQPPLKIALILLLSEATGI